MPSLYDVLRTRETINLLKLLYDKEHKERSAHTLTLAQADSILGFKVSLNTVLMLEAAGLITAEKVEDSFVMGLQSRGKDFIEAFDDMKSAFDGTAKKDKAIRLEYDLTKQEENILKTLDGGKTMAKLVKKLFPRSNQSTKRRQVSKDVSRLEKLKLIRKDRKGRETVIEPTPQGRRVLDEQLSRP